MECTQHTQHISSQALMNGSDTYQRNERNRQEFSKIRAAAAVAHAHQQHAQGGINLPFFLGMGLALGLNILGYFAFKTYFRSFLNSLKFKPTNSGAPYGIHRSDFEGVKRYKQQRQQQHQQYYQKQSSTPSNSQHQAEHRSHSSSSSTIRKQQDERNAVIKKHLLQLDMPLSSLNPSVADIKTAYRKICLKTHPDVAVVGSSKGNGKEGQGYSHRELEQRFLQATAAHDELLRRLHGK